MPSNTDRGEQPVWQLVATWLLIIPLVFYGGMGGFWFQRGAGNNALSAGFSSLVDPPNSLQSIVTSALVFGIIFLLLFPKIKPVFHRLWSDKIFLFSVVLAISSTAWSQFPDKSIRWSVALGVETVFAFFVYERFTARRFFTVLLMLGWVGLCLSIFLSLFFPQYGIDFKEGIGSWQGMYGNKNTCSMITSFMLPVAFYAPAPTISAKARRVAYIVLSVFLIIMSQSATGKILLAAIATYVIAMQTTRRFGSRDKAVALIVVGTLSFVLIVTGITYFAELSYLLGKDPTLTGRTTIWAATMVSVLKRPMFGYGYQAFWRGFQGEAANVSLANGWSSVYAHSGYMDVLTELGVMGIVVFLFTFVRAIRDAGLCLKGKDSPFVTWALCIVLLTLLLNVDEVSILISYHLLWILYIIACIGLSERARFARSGLLYEN